MTGAQNGTLHVLPEKREKNGEFSVQNKEQDEREKRKRKERSENKMIPQCTWFTLTPLSPSPPQQPTACRHECKLSPFYCAFSDMPQKSQKLHFHHMRCQLLLLLLLMLLIDVWVCMCVCASMCVCVHESVCVFAFYFNFPRRLMEHMMRSVELPFSLLFPLPSSTPPHPLSSLQSSRWSTLHFRLMLKLCTDVKASSASRSVRKTKPSQADNQNNPLIPFPPRFLHPLLLHARHSICRSWARFNKSKLKSALICFYYLCSYLFVCTRQINCTRKKGIQNANTLTHVDTPDRYIKSSSIWKVNKCDPVGKGVKNK